MALPQVKSCCGCIPLKPGCLVIGWLIVVCSSLECLSMMGSTAVRNNQMRVSDDTVNTDPDIQFAAPVTFGVDAMHVLNLITGVMLLIGTYKAKADYLLPFLVLKGIELIVILIIIAVLFFASGLLIANSNSGENANKNDATENAVIGGILFAFGASIALVSLFNVHCFLVVNSYYTQLKQIGSDGDCRSATGTTGCLVKAHQMV